MILSHSEIEKALQTGDIVCVTQDAGAVLNPKTLKTQSIDVRLGQYIWVWDGKDFSLTDLDNEEQKDALNQKVAAAAELGKSLFLLAHTEEFIGTRHGSKILPTFKLKSSAGRQGIMHTLAGHGDEGFINRWAMEFVCLRPIILSRYMSIGQIYFQKIEGESDDYGAVGSYQEASTLNEVMSSWSPNVLLPKDLKIIKEI